MTFLLLLIHFTVHLYFVHRHDTDHFGLKQCVTTEARYMYNKLTKWMFR